MDVFRVVQTDLIKTTSAASDHTVNTQILPAWIAARWGVDELQNATTVETDVNAPKDRKVEADTMASLGNAVKVLVEAIRSAQIAAGVEKPIALDVGEILARFGMPTVASAAPLMLTQGDPEQRGAPTGEQLPLALPAAPSTD
jgi:ribosomal protein L12E/L44/L45/RPP1/RPP2